MSNTIRLGLAAIVFFGTVNPLQGQSESRLVAEIKVESILAVPQIYVSLRLTTLERQVFVPYCGESEYGEKILCTLGTHLEVQTSQGWRPAKLRTTYGVLGAVRLGHASGSLIGPKDGAPFIIQFSRRFFEVEPGQQLRVIVDVWPDEQSMKTSGRSFQLASPPFQCPDIGTGS